MKRLGLIAAFAGVAAFGAGTSHDAPLEVQSNTVHVFFRADTLIDPLLARNKNLADASQILQHTHEMEHKVRIFVGGRAPSDVTIKPKDELHFRLAGKRRFFGLFPGTFRGYLTVKPEIKSGAGGLVAGHAAKVRETSRDCIEKVGTQLGDCVPGKLGPDDIDSLDLVWVAQAPNGLAWEGKGAFANPSNITNAINSAAQAPNHDAARDTAKVTGRIEYELKGGAEVFVDRFYVVANGKTPKGHGIELHRGSRVVVCENRTQKDPNTGKNIVSQDCPAN